MIELPAPQERERIVGRGDVELALRALLAAGSLSHGWILSGPPGAGKATLAYRVARALLDRASLGDGSSLDIDPGKRVFRLVAGGAHPDLFIAKRQFDEKSDRLETEISVDTIRKLIAFANRTPAMSDWRVAIVDAADEMNRNAANALLKVLEEPPPRMTLILVSHSPGRLLATIRSRCRKIALKPLPDETIASLLRAERGLDERSAAAVTALARGRPGYALDLAAGEGAEAMKLVERFIADIMTGGEAAAVAGALTGRNAAGLWETFQRALPDAIEAAARAAAAGDNVAEPLAGVSAPSLAQAHAAVAALLRRGEAVNLDRTQLVLAAGRSLRAALHDIAA